MSQIAALTIRLGDNPAMKKMIVSLYLGASMGLVQPALATGLEQLKQFGVEVRSAEGAFSQTVLSKSGKKPQQSSGSFYLQRPGKFRWSYDKPYPQLLVSDGKTLWSFDPELKQVAIKKVGNALGASPAALLAGQDIEKCFVLRELPPRDGVEFVEAVPKTTDASFERVVIGMRGSQPVSMEIHDSFGQVSRLAFERFTLNPALEPGLFRFVPPAGADVLKE
jgi:outer membrane lipoprotein carrier protein